MRAAIYCRVSSTQQAKEGDSISAQLDALNKYAIERKYEIIGTFVDDGVSGTKYSERDELQRLLQLVQEDKVDIILIAKLDRWFRSIRHYVATQAILDEHNVGWLAIWEPIYDTTTPQGRLIVNQMMSIAQFEAENTSSRIKQVFAYKAQNREVLSGNIPPGYSIENKHLVPNEQANDIRRAFDVYDRTNSIADTVRAMEGTGLPTTTQGMKYLLKRRVYIGEAHGLADFCEPIVERDVFDRVQIALSRNIKRSQKRTYLFTGLIHCKDCGSLMISSCRNGRGDKSLYYRCKGHYQKLQDRCVNSKVIYESVLEKMLIDMLPDLIVEQVEMHKKRSAPVISYERQKSALEKKIERLKVLFVNDEISLEEYRVDKATLMKQIAELAPVKPSEPPQAVLQLQGMDVKAIYETLTKEERRTFWRGIIKDIRFDHDRHFYFDFL